MKKLIPLILLALLSCQKYETWDSLVSGIQFKPTDNVLRYELSVSLKKQCKWSVELREKGSDNWRVMPGNVIMFILPETTYEYRVHVSNLYSEAEEFTTGALPDEVPSFTLDVDNGTPDTGYLMQTKESAPGYVTFCDMQGRVVWYQSFPEDGVRCSHYVPEQGKIALLLGHKTEQASTGAHRPKYGRRIVVMDLAGNCSTDFLTTADNTEFPHHEIKLMPDGNIITVEAVRKMVDIPESGYSDLEIWGDGYVILSPEGKRISDWNIFGELDVAENASWLYPEEYQYDLVHANSVSWDADGNYYMTFHYITEIWKIDGKNGKVLYRLGEHGNLKLDVPYAEGGFHAVIPLEADKFLVNNNARGAGAQTHAQIYQVDTETMSATRLLNVANKPEYSVYTGGNVELLPDGKTLHFDSTGPKSSVFMDLEGNILKVFRREDTSYRAFYFPDLP